MLFCCSVIEWEQSVEFGINHVGDDAEVFVGILKLHRVAFNDDEVAFVGRYPVLVKVVKSLQIIDAD